LVSYRTKATYIQEKIQAEEKLFQNHVQKHMEICLEEIVLCKDRDMHFNAAVVTVVDRGRPL